jgi:hypothetical protein
MTKTLSESQSVDDHSKAGESSGTNVHEEEARKNNDGTEEEENEDEDEVIKMT